MSWRKAPNPKLQAFKKLRLQVANAQSLSKSFFHGTARQRRVPAPKKFQTPNLNPPPYIARASLELEIWSFFAGLEAGI